MLKRTKRQLLIIFLVVSTLSFVHFIYNNVNVNNIKNVLIIDDNIDKYFGTKSRYPLRSEIFIANLNIDSKFQLRQVQLVCRHGTRYPTGSRNFNEKIELMKEFLISKSELFPEKFSFLVFFKNPYNKSNYGSLDIQGVRDMQNLAKRAMNRYNNIIKTINDLSKVRIYSTNVSRVIDSAAAFVSTLKIHLDEMNGIDSNEDDNVKVDKENSIVEEDIPLETISVEKRNSKYDENKVKMLLETDINNYEDDFSYFQNDEILKYINIYKDRSKDIILSPHIACPLFNEEINSKDNAKIKDNIKLLEDKYIQGVNNNLMKALNLDEVPTVGESIMSTCIFEVALNNTRNQFCSLIDKNSLENYGFYENYRNYHIKGYYIEVNQWLVTPLFKEIVNDIDIEILQTKAPMKVQNNNNNTNIILRFAHAETIFPLITLLGLYKDKKHLTLKDSPPNDNYVFRSSEMVPFAANFWFELYEIETKYIIGYKPKDDIIYIDNPFGNNTNILENLEKSEEQQQNKNSTFVIRILLNEKDISIPGCSPIEIVDLKTREKTKYKTICLLSQFKHLYKSILNTTINDYKKKCHIVN